MLPDRVSNPGPLTYESGALPIALRGPAVVTLQLVRNILGTKRQKLTMAEAEFRSIWTAHASYVVMEQLIYSFLFMFLFQANKNECQDVDTHTRKQISFVFTVE